MRRVEWLVDKLAVGDDLEEFGVDQHEIDRFLRIPKIRTVSQLREELHKLRIKSDIIRQVVKRLEDDLDMLNPEDIQSVRS